MLPKTPRPLAVATLVVVLVLLVRFVAGCASAPPEPPTRELIVRADPARPIPHALAMEIAASDGGPEIDARLRAWSTIVALAAEHDLLDAITPGARSVVHAWSGFRAPLPDTVSVDLWSGVEILPAGPDIVVRIVPTHATLYAQELARAGELDALREFVIDGWAALIPAQ